jgi:quercetin dioxygenase-like cupin family protein
MRLKAFNFKEVAAQNADGDKARIRWLINEANGAENFSMRLIEIAPGGSSAHHSHEWEHEVFVLEGKGYIKGEKGKEILGKGTVVLIPKNEVHQFKNDGAKPLKFLCVIPIKKPASGSYERGQLSKKE